MSTHAHKHANHDSSLATQINSQSPADPTHTHGNAGAARQVTAAELEAASRAASAENVTGVTAAAPDDGAETPRNAEPATPLEFLSDQVARAHKRIDELFATQQANDDAALTMRRREVALHSALTHHRQDGTTGCEDKKVLTSAAAFAAYLETGDAPRT